MQDLKIILVDELIVLLDFMNVQIVMEVLCCIYEEDGCIVICNLYILDIVCCYCDCVIGMCVGCVVFDGIFDQLIMGVVCDIYGVGDDFFEVVILIEIDVLDWSDLVVVMFV